MVQVCITGASGFLGFNLLQKLIKKEWHITILHRKQSNLEKLKTLNVTLVCCEQLSKPDLLKKIPDNINYFFHVSANTSYCPLNNKQQYLDNVVATENLVSVAIKKKVRRFIYTSTADAFGWHDFEVDESIPSNANKIPVNYVKTKHLAECVVKNSQQRGLDIVILNPTNIMGAYDSKNWAKVFILIKEKALPFNFPGTGNFCYVGDVADAHIAAAEKGKSGENYILGGEILSFVDLSMKVAKIIGVKNPTWIPNKFSLRLLGTGLNLFTWITKNPAILSRAEIEFLTRKLLYSSKKAQKELGYKRSNSDIFLKETYSFLKKEGII